MYLYVNVAAHLNDLLNLFTRQPLLPLLARILKEKINHKREQNSKSPRVQEICLEGYSIFVQQMA